MFTRRSLGRFLALLPFAGAAQIAQGAPVARVIDLATGMDARNMPGAAPIPMKAIEMQIKFDPGELQRTYERAFNDAIEFMIKDNVIVDDRFYYDDWGC